MTRLDVRQDVIKAAGWVLFGLFVLFVLYECFAMWRAYQRTPDVVATARRAELKASDLSADRRAILLAVEDPTFDTNSGVDWSTPGQGATTIGQALAKRGNRLEGVLILFAALLVSPLGYLLIGPLAQMTDNAAGSLF